VGFACCVNFSTREKNEQFPVMPVAVFESRISDDWFRGVGRLDSKQQKFGASVRRLGGTLGIQIGDHRHNTVQEQCQQHHINTLFILYNPASGQASHYYQ
jgi:hypothetical protein